MTKAEIIKEIQKCMDKNKAINTKVMCTLRDDKLDSISLSHKYAEDARYHSLQYALSWVLGMLYEMEG